MARQEIGALVARVAGLYCFIQSLPYVNSFAGFAFHGSSMRDNPAFVLLSLLPALALIAGGILLWVYALPIGHRLIGNAPDKPVTEPWTSREIQTIAFSVIGLYLIAVKLPALLIAVGQFLHLRTLSAEQSRMQMEAAMLEWWYRIGEYAISLGLGLWLFLGARGLSNLWHRLRTVGTPAAKQPTDSHQP